MNGSSIDPIRAWKDPEYRESLSEEERAALPPNPAGAVELTDAELAAANGGAPGTGAPRPKVIPYTQYSPAVCNYH